MTIPADADARRAVPPVICYPTDTLPVPDMARYRRALDGAMAVSQLLAPPRGACHFRVKAG
ncbi:hypothetical protein AL036_20190, partial [Salipiger aestuarii]